MGCSFEDDSALGEVDEDVMAIVLVTGQPGKRQRVVVTPTHPSPFSFNCIICFFAFLLGLH